jgi:hypothetical protein
MRCADERSGSLDADISGEDVEADRDETLCLTFGRF